MEMNIEEIFNKILKRINEEERKNSGYYLYTENGFIKYQDYFNKKTLSLNIKIIENRKQDIIEILNGLNVKYKITNDNENYIVLEIKENCNYIICEYVVNSHVTIPKSFLRHFGRKSKDGMIVDYIDMDCMTIESKKAKEYGAVYGYYNKFIEKYLSDNFETKIGNISKEINNFRNNEIENLNFSKEKLEDIYNFFDITTYRNPKILEQLNASSLSSKLIGGYDHNHLLQFVANSNSPHIYNGLKFNTIINKTDRDFIINDTMISSIFCDNGNEIIILPINKKECLVLMQEEYYKKYVIGNKLYFMNIEDECEVEMINRYIFRYAKKNRENVIGSKNELEVLLNYEVNSKKKGE